MEQVASPEKSSTIVSDMEVPDSPPHATPACDPLPCLASLSRLLLLSGSLNLPSDFCQRLLQLPRGDLAAKDMDRELGSSSLANEIEDAIVAGMPVDPLYVHLAAALYRWIFTKCFPRNLAPIEGIKEDESWKSRLDAWTEAVVAQGSALLELWQGIALKLDVQEPWSSVLKDGKKNVEGRCATDAYKSLSPGCLMLVNDSFLLQIKGVHWYPTFQIMIQTEGLVNVLPGVESIGEGVQIYRKFYSCSKEQTYGVLGIHVVRPAMRDPADLLSDILNTLGIDGVRVLLGMRTTNGTLSGRLGGLEIAGCRISVGARALAKHAPRSLAGWWGSVSGTEAAKNKLAETTLHRLMKHAVWINIHLAPIPIFEIRVADGYGARWLADGSKFRGFLEPPMEEGHMVKWRH